MNATFGTATNLVGFRSSTLRVEVLERRDGYVWVRTADLLDVGTPLTLDASQVTSEAEGSVVVHKDGLVILG